MTHKNSNWIIQEEAFSTSTAKAYEGLFTLGSGILHIRGSLEEHLHNDPQNIEYFRMPTNVTAEVFPDTKMKWGTYIPYIVGPHPTLNVEMLNLPFFLGIVPFSGDEKLDMQESNILDYSRQLDLRTATLLRSMKWMAKNGQNISVQFRRFVSAVHPKLCVQQIILSSEKDAKVTVHSGIDADVRTSGYDHFDAVELVADSNNEILCSVHTNGGDTVNILSKIILPNVNWQYIHKYRKGYFEAEITIPAGQQVIVEKRTAVSTNLDRVSESPQSILEEVAKLTYEQLHEEHCKCWLQQWNKADVLIEGDATSQLAIRGSIYHLLRAQNADDSRVSVDAKGFSGDAYFGCYFWDTEMYIMPFFLYTDPQRAQKLVEFRVNTLDIAKKNAISQGYKGAKYPWFTDTSGLERCLLSIYAEHEIHITADVAYALAHYTLAADPNYLWGSAGKVIVETARFWMERIEWSPDGECRGILGVMGPDEYSPITNNNAYTNAIVSYSLTLASEIGEFHGLAAEECKKFRDTAKQLPVPRNERIILQHEDFESLGEPNFEKLWVDASKGFASHVRMEKLYRTKALKQPDVLMLMFLLPHHFKRQEIHDAWSYYVPYTTHDSSLSAGVHSILAAKIGLNEEAWRFCQESFSKDFDTAKGGAKEGMHIACCAANWMIAVQGFAGMQIAIQTEILTFEPNLPEKWKKLSFPIVWRGQSAFIELSHDRLIVHNKSDKALNVKVFENIRSVSAAHSVVFDVRQDEISRQLSHMREKIKNTKISEKRKYKIHNIASTDRSDKGGIR